MKTVLFAPGNGEGLHDRDYSSLIAGIAGKGYDARFVDIPWAGHTVPRDWAARLKHLTDERGPENVILAGFSFGALAAFFAATQRPVDGLWLCSLSCFFKEDLARFPVEWKMPETQHVADSMADIPFVPCAGTVAARQTLVFVGVQERQLMVDRSKEAAAVIPQARLVLVEGVGHDVADPQYIQAIVDSVPTPAN